MLLVVYLQVSVVSEVVVVISVLVIVLVIVIMFVVTVMVVCMSVNDGLDGFLASFLGLLNLVLDVFLAKEALWAGMLVRLYKIKPKSVFKIKSNKIIQS